jgi:hypothetical protein
VEKLSRISARRASGWRIGTAVLVQVLIVAVIIGAVNYLGFHYYKRIDLSRSQQFRLSTITQQAIRQLEEPLRVTVYFSPTAVTAESLIAQDVTNLLKELQFAAKQNMEIEFVDPMRNLSRAREIQNRLKFGAQENLLILEYRGRQSFLPVGEMAEFDFTPMMAGGSPRVEVFRGEQAFTSVLLGLLDPGERKIYFTTGHGEEKIDLNGELSIFAEYAERLNAEVEPLNLAAKLEVPDDASVLVIAGPRFDFRSPQIEAIKKYWRGDGRILILLDPDSPTPNLDQFAADIGIQPVNQRVLRTVQLGFAIGILRDVAGDFLPDSEITRRLEGVTAYLPDPVQPLLLDEAASGAAGTLLRPLIRAKEDYWGEAQFITDENTGVQYDDGVDTGYPVYVAVAAERGAIRDERVDLQAAKTVVVGNVLLATNQGLSGPDGSVANIDFLVSTLNWLMDRSKLTGITPKPPREFQLVITDRQMGNISLVTMILMPGTAALFGLFVWWRRRR